MKGNKLLAVPDTRRNGKLLINANRKGRIAKKHMSGLATIRPSDRRRLRAVFEYANTAALLFEQNGVAGPHLTGREYRRVNSRAFPVLLNDAF